MTTGDRRTRELEPMLKASGLHIAFGPGEKCKCESTTAVIILCNNGQSRSHFVTGDQEAHHGKRDQDGVDGIRAIILRDEQINSFNSCLTQEVRHGSTSL